VPLDIAAKETEGVTILSLRGKLILGDETLQLGDAIQKLLAENKKFILLNLEKLTFIDSAGVGTLIAAFSSARTRGATVKLTNPSPKFQETLQITRMMTIFEVFDSEQKALASFK
jgi:anti-sigma B factor antagonist